MDRDDPQFVLNHLCELEKLAEDVLTTRQHIVELSKQQNSNREALSALAKDTLCPPRSRDKVWVNMGGMFIKLKKDECKSMIQTSQKEISKEIKTSKDSLLPKVNVLKDAQGEDYLKGYNLTPLTKEELNQTVCT